MSTSEPFLHPSDDQPVCKICNKDIVKKKELCVIKDWTAIIKYAEQWKNLRIPKVDRFADFPNIHERIISITERSVHQSCRTDIRLKLSRYKKYQSEVCEDNTVNVDEPLSVEVVELGPSTPCTRSALASPTEKRSCFVCNTEKEESTSRISKEAVANKTKQCKDIHLDNPNSLYHIAAKRLDLMLRGHAVDLYAADIYYHKHCLVYFNRLTKDAAEVDPMIEVVQTHFISYVTVKICNQKNAYLMHDLLSDANYMSEEHNIDPIFSCTKSLRRYLETNLGEKIAFFKSPSNHVIVYSSDIDPILYSVSTLKGHGLRKNDIIAAFAKMIQHVTDELDEKEDIEWPASPDDLISGLSHDRPIAELFNTVYMTMNRNWTSSVGLNEHGFAKTRSRNIANKIWSIASDWTALITGKKNAKQINLAMVIHRLTASKEVVSILNKAGHAISYNDVRLQNDEFLSSTKQMGGILTGLMKNVVTHSSLDNNDMRQDTNTGHCTTHHTNFLIFQPSPPKDDACISSTPSFDRCTSNCNTDPDYKIGKLVPPPLMKDYKEEESSSLIDESFAKDVLWSLAGGLPSNDDEDELPLLGSWTAFNKVVCNEEAVKSLLNYLPANENPPEYPVCKEYLEFILEVMDCLDIPRIFVHADEQVYARILHLVWKHKDKFKSIIPLMGGFHQLRVFQKVIYKCHNVIGYQDWYSDSGIIAEGSAPQAFEGRHYYRSMRIHKEGFDALAQHRIENLTDNYKKLDPNLVDHLKQLRLTPSGDLVKEILGSSEYNQFLKTFQSTSDTRSNMTMQYLKDVSLMLSIVSAVRERCYNRHLEAERQFLKLVFAFDHINYARYNAYYHVYMTNMKNTNNDAYKELTKFGFGCTSTDKERFSTKHGDLETEHFNKETKGTAGPFRSGYSTDIHAVNRWIKTSHIHAKLRKAVKSYFRIYTSSVHKEMTTRNKKRHYEHVQCLKKKLRDYNTEPFKPGPVKNIVSGKEIDGVIVECLLGATKKGDELYNKFVADRLVTGKVSIFDTIKKNNIKTGAEIKKKSSKKVNVLIEERQAFGAMIAKCNTKEEAFSYPITSLPSSIANPDGSLYNSNKSTFRNELIGQSFANKSNPNATWIIDMGYAIRQIKPKDTYKEYYHDLLEWILPDGTLLPSSVVVAVDNYIKQSTKEGERINRRGGNDEGKRIYVTGLDQKMPKGEVRWSNFLTNGENKNDLMAVFGEYLKTNEAISKANGVPIIFCGREEVWEILPDKWQSKEMCNHEEADTKIPLFASKADGNIVAVAADCDILLLLITSYAIIKLKYQWQMKYENDKFANIGEICKRLGNEVSPLLMHFHAISGCDTTSYFFRLSKKTPFKKALETGKLHLLKSLGADIHISDECVNNCKEFIRTVLYKGNARESYLETRIRLYVNQSIASKSTMTIPPDQDSCTQHILRAHYQMYIWSHYHTDQYLELSNSSNGWKKCDMLSPVWFQGPQFPPSFGKKTRNMTASDGYEADNEYKKGAHKQRRQKKQKRVNESDCSSRGRKFRRIIPELLSDTNDVSCDVTEVEPTTTAESLDVLTASTNDQTVSEGEPSLTNEEQSGNDANDEMEDAVDDNNSDVDDDSDEWEHFSEFDETSNSSDSDWM